MPVNIFSRDFWHWIVVHIPGSFHELIVFKNNLAPATEVIWFACIAFTILSAVVLIRKRNYKPLMLLLPVGIHLVLSATHMYPFGGRLILYLSPGFFFFTSFGLEQVLVNLRVRITTRTATFVLAAALLLIAVVRLPVYREEIKEAFNYFNTQKPNVSALLVYDNAIPCFRFYAYYPYPVIPKTKFVYVHSPEEIKSYSLGNKNFSIVFIHLGQKSKEENTMKQLMIDCNMKEIFRAKGVVVYGWSGDG
jgi:hypothetical protein